MTTPALRPLTNRDFNLPADGYCHILPPGIHPHQSGRKQVVDDKAFEAILNAFAQDKEKKSEVDDGGVLLADYDHFSNDPNQKSEAAGWIEDLQRRDDGLYAKIRWSTSGAKAVRGGDYRYVSPVWNREDVEQIDKDTIRPLRIDRIGLTNDPNIKGMRPLRNRWTVTDAPLVETRKERLERITNSVFGNDGQADRVLNSSRTATSEDLRKNPPEILSGRGWVPFGPGRGALSGEGRAALQAYANRDTGTASLTPGEQRLLERDQSRHDIKISKHSDQDAAAVPLYIPADQIDKIFHDAVKKYLDQGMDYKSAWLAAKANNPVAFRAYSA